MKKTRHYNSYNTNKPNKSPIKQRFREGRGIVYLIGAVFLLLLLLSYSYPHIGISINLKNYGGHTGDLLVRNLFKFFGTMAYAFPTLIAYTGIRHLRSRFNKKPTHGFVRRLLQTTGFIAILSAGCGLYAGGQLGAYITTRLTPLLSINNSRLFLISLSLTGLTLLTGTAWLNFIKLLIKISIGCFIYMIKTLLKLIRGKSSASPKTQSLVNKKFSPTLNTDLHLSAPKREASAPNRRIDIIENREHGRRVQNTSPGLTMSLGARQPVAESLEKSTLLPKPASVYTLHNKTSEKENLTAPNISIPIENPKPPSPEAFLKHQSYIQQKSSLDAAIASSTAASMPEPNIAHSTKQSIEQEATATNLDIKQHLLPSLDLLDTPTSETKAAYSPEELTQLSREVELRLKDFGIEVQVVSVHPGPVVTRFEMQLAPGIKVSRITTLSKDLARSLSVISVRIVEIIPGKSVVGLELPNRHRETVRLQEILSTSVYQKTAAPLPLALGKDIAGHPVVVNLSKMPHLLAAGTTGSGKSVGLNVMLLSILYKATPEQVRFILIDPKMLELAIYEGIPHLLAPVVTDMKEAANALRWCVAEMERRYKLMASLGVRNLLGYNQKIQEALDKGHPIKNPFIQTDEEANAPQSLTPLPYIVVLIDEFADMIMVVGKKVEELIARIAQKARAAGIHLILATQRPSVDVITGLIKANIPTRIAFQVSSRIDSRTILDQQGAEQLLGHGDMLYLAPGTGIPTRVHGAFVEDHEVHRVVNALKQSGPPDYQLKLNEDLYGDHGELNEKSKDASGEEDPLYDQAVQIVLETRRASISGIQRRLKIGYNRAARLIESMEEAGLVSPMETNGNREVLIPE